MLFGTCPDIGVPRKNLPFSSRQIAILEIEQLSAEGIGSQATVAVAFCIYADYASMADFAAPNFFN
jgi:hypothetical protein